MRIAVVGTGVGGLVAAWLLSREHDLVVYEADERLGGHVHTHDVELDGRALAVDSGFIVFNRECYPNFARLLDELGVATRPTSMSFSVQCERTGLEYNGTSLDGLFAQRRNLLRPSFHGMLRDVLRFHREAPALLAPGGGDGGPTLDAWLRAGRYGRRFVEHYLVPMGSAIWSTGPQDLLGFPAAELVRFFHNHGMLTVDDRPQWRVVEGGSRRYVERLAAPFADRVRLATPVASVRRRADGVELRTAAGDVARFDHVVLAVHADQALALLADPTADERQVLGALPFHANEAVLHTDARLLPRARRAWASWNYFVPAGGRPRATVTYDMSILQGLDTARPLCVTLNRSEAIDPAAVLSVMRYDHPAYTAQSFAARRRWKDVSGVHRTHYSGAYWGYGFHEDGVNAALAVCRDLGVRWDGASDASRVAPDVVSARGWTSGGRPLPPRARPARKSAPTVGRRLARSVPAPSPPSRP